VNSMIVLSSIQFLPHPGGVSVHVNELAKALSRQGQDVKIITSFARNNVSTNLHSDGVEVHRLPILRSRISQIQILSFSIKADNFIRSCIKGKDVLGVQFHGTSGIFSMLKRNFPVPILSKIHGLWDVQLPLVKYIVANEPLLNREFGLKGKIGECVIHADAKTTNRICYTLSPHLIAISQSVKDELNKYYGICDRQISVVNNGVNHQLFYPKNVPNKLVEKLRINRPVVLFSGDFSSAKGFHYLPYIIKRVTKCVNACFIIVGGYNNNRALAIQQQFKALGLGSFVKVVGYVPYEELPDYYALAQVFICPTLYEGFGNAALEAMACAKPIITFGTNGLKDFFDDSAGLKADFLNAEDFASKLIEILTDKTLRDEKGYNAYKQSLKFSWDITAKKTIDIFKGLS
jgi:glycosyltransferase involved in cell wall biosynthesis